MSEQTKADLDAAIAAHVADEAEGAIIASYVLQTDFTSIALMDEEATGFMRFTSEHQSLTATLGLITYARRQLDHFMTHDEDDQE